VQDLGVADSVRITENKTFIINDDGELSESVKNRVFLLKDERDKLANLSSELDRDLEIVRLENRIAQLEKNAVVFYAGGISEEEKENRKYLLEDAVAAVKSAIEYGYNIGGSINIPFLLNSDQIIKEIQSKLGNPNLFGLIDLVSNAFLSIYTRVMLNAKITDDVLKQRIELAKKGILINILTNEDEKINDKGNKTIQSVQTDIEILKASLSIIGLLATSKVFISLNLNRTES
jgi:chaperonin GroEL (HSP60 family)